MDLMVPDSGLLFWMTIIFLIVFLILAKFGFPIITGMVEKRNKKIDDALEAARRAEEAIAHLSDEQGKIIAESRLEQSRILKETASEKDRIIAQAKEMAQQEAKKMIEEAREKIAKEKEAALKDIRNEVAELSLAIAEQVVRKELKNDSAQRELVDKLLKNI